MAPFHRYKIKYLAYVPTDGNVALKFVPCQSALRALDLLTLLDGLQWLETVMITTEITTT